MIALVAPARVTPAARSHQRLERLYPAAFTCTRGGLVVVGLLFWLAVRKPTRRSQRDRGRE
jgi:hypothetical protein